MDTYNDNFKRFKYKITQNDGEYYLSGQSVPEDSEHLIPIQFSVKYNNYVDKENNDGKEVRRFMIRFGFNNSEVVIFF